MTSSSDEEQQTQQTQQTVIDELSDAITDLRISLEGYHADQRSHNIQIAGGIVNTTDILRSISSRLTAVERQVTELSTSARRTSEFFSEASRQNREAEAAAERSRGESGQPANFPAPRARYIVQNIEIYPAITNRRPRVNDYVIFTNKYRNERGLLGVVREAESSAFFFVQVSPTEQLKKKYTSLRIVHKSDVEGFLDISPA